jgi:hypothetical protein
MFPFPPRRGTPVGSLTGSAARRSIAVRVYLPIGAKTFIEFTGADVLDKPEAVRGVISQTTMISTGHGSMFHLGEQTALLDRF